MAQRDFIDVGQRVQLEVTSPTLGGRFRARVVQAGKDRLVLGCVGPDKEPVTLPDGAIVQCTFMTASGRASFESKVLGATRDSHVILAVPSEVQHSQRRHFVRVRDRIPVTFRFETRGPDPVKVLARCTTNDISAGGLSVKVERMSPTVPLTQGTVGRIELSLKGQSEPLRCTSAVMRVVTNKRDNKIELSLQFVGLPEEERRRVLQYVFQRQAKRRALW